MNGDKGGGARVIAQHAAPEQLALVHRGRRTTYGELEADIGCAASALQMQGVQRGDRVLLQLDKGLPFIALHLACLRRGVVSVPCPPFATDVEIAHVHADSGASLHVHAGNVAELLESGRRLGAAAPVPPPAPDDGAVLLYTSGTTGSSKGVLLSQRNLRANTLALAAAWEWSAADVLLHALPLFHVHGLLVALHGALAAGATTILMEHFDAGAVLESLHAERCTVFMGVPTMYHRLAQLPRPAGGPATDAARPADAELPGMRLFACGSAPLRPDTATAFRERFGHAILQRYGMTEALMIASHPLHGERRPGWVGPALPGVQLRIAAHAAMADGAGTARSAPRSRASLPTGDVGEVLVRGPSVFAGYWGRPDLTPAVLDAEGWFATGDLGHLDEHGWLALVGRARELIISGGFNVYPKEVELALECHPDVSEAAVFGLPDADLGEIVAAAVVPGAGAAAPAAALVARILDHCRGRLAAYKCPRTLALLDALPRNALGKVQKAQLAARPEFQRAPGRRAEQRSEERTDRRTGLRDG